jgi:hypothetical protein
VKNKKKEESEPKDRKSNAVSRGFSSILNGTFLTRETVLGNMSFILFCAFLMICYIAYGHFTEHTVQDLDRADRELKELRSEYITIRSELEQTEQQSQVANDIEQLGLKETRVPPRKVPADPSIIQTQTRDVEE